MLLRSRWVRTEGPWEGWVWLVGQVHGNGRWMKTHRQLLLQQQQGGAGCRGEAGGYALRLGSGFEGTWGQHVAEDAQATLAMDKA